MEEDIKILRNTLSRYCYKNCKGEIKSECDNCKRFQAIENLLKRYKEMEERQKIQEHNYQVALSETVNKYVIREKIEELKNYYENKIYPTKYQWADIDITEFFDNQIELLQELLKEEE